MSRLLFDTTFLIDAERAEEVLEALIDDEDDVAVAAVTIAELRVGALLANEDRRESREAFLADVLDVIPVIDYDLEVAEAHAGLLVEVRTQGMPRGAHDLIIAATARQARRIVVTADASAFRDLGGVETRSIAKGSPRL